MLMPTKRTLVAEAQIVAAARLPTTPVASGWRNASAAASPAPA
jgi:hypothetical protein